MTDNQHQGASTGVEIGDRLREERQRIGLNQAAFAEQVGVSKTTQSNYESGGRSPDALYLVRAVAIGVDAHYILTGRRFAAQEDLYITIPVLPVHASAGSGALNSDESDGQYGMCVPRDWLKQKGLNAQQLKVIRVKGQSMEGVLSDGDQVLVDVTDTHPRSGFVYVLRQGEELLVKHCTLLPGGLLRVTSANPSYAPYDVDLSRTDDVQIVGRVVASTHEW